MSSKVFAKKAQNSAPDYFSPYNALTINMILTILDPNSAPYLIHTFSQGGVVIYAFCVSHTITLGSFIAAIVKAIRKESQYTTDEYVKLDGTSFL